MAASAPRPSGSGAVAWKASEDSPPPARRSEASPAGSRSTVKKAAPSPRLMPRRFRLKGLHGSRSTASRAWKPKSTASETMSAPPATTASQAPVASRFRARTRARALEVQAVETLQAKPLNPR